MRSVLAFEKQPRLTLVGAGPGDPELITLKAINALKVADIVLYDALISEEILSYIPSSTPGICVGKRAGEHSYKQDEINELIVEFAYLYGHVVRLKGGDPFVFGRATEEIQFAHQHGIETQVVPGVSSAIAVPASADIPVTSRGISESFWVVTGTTKSGEMSKDISLAAQSTATVIILMGLHKIEEIMQVFVSYGKSDTPVAVIRNGTLPDQQFVSGMASTIAEIVREEGIASPAIIVVGEVVRLGKELQKIVANHIVSK
ncbi:uroporphyrinogen-III C-methyltransferase [Chryseosolibacter indicus]|uniref:uroporphyrinogen-III C-methyltransferase n=1 Tax=Chryseosolibacter indicus TaxID=2782351 RepID=A0ABS5VNQ2_9BACT|nr:uroporphyrinogen-III C-methyltransferase [Chryseosolibacter indicus]MBT1702470.1 uroporphyrinogen-III C-methyltransferase [Chryseosolibacter indicus]